MGQSLSSGRRIIAVLCGGFFGTIVRYLLSVTIQGWFGKNWPYDILIINLSGAFLLALITSFADATFLVGPTRRIIINVGFLGAYTTFSSLALGDALLIEQQHIAAAITYLLFSLLGGIAVVLLGDLLGQSIVRFVGQDIELGVLKPATTIKPEFAPNATGKLGQPEHVDIDDDLLLPDETNEE